MRKTGKMSVPNGFLALIVVFIFIAGIATMLVSGHNISTGKQKNSTVSTSVPETDSTDILADIDSRAVSPNAFEEESNLPNGYRLITVLNEDTYKGPLILVNYQYESKIDGENIVNLFDNVTDSVGVKDNDLFINNSVIEPMNNLFDAFKEAKGSTTILISSAYRSKINQTHIYSNSVRDTGEKSTEYYVAVPGYSEHQTGYCFDTAAINYNGEMVELDGEGDFSWLSDNCGDYGFILRYPEDKTNITGIGYESWHFRYVGVPHSTFINKNKLCLEEYITGLQKYTLDNGGLLIDNGSQGKWVVFYVPKLEAFNNTDIPVPIDSEKTPYTVSGDNIGGFIVTVDVTKDPSNELISKATSNWQFDNSSIVIKDFVDYDPLNDTEDDSDSSENAVGDNNDDWEDDSFWDEYEDDEFEYVDYYDEYDGSYDGGDYAENYDENNYQ